MKSQVFFLRVGGFIGVMGLIALGSQGLAGIEKGALVIMAVVVLAQLADFVKNLWF